MNLVQSAECLGLVLEIWQGAQTGQSRKKGVSGIPNWEEIQNPLERLYSLSDLEMPRDHSGETGKCGWGEGCLKYTA